MNWPTWDEWLNSLEDGKKAAAIGRRDLFASLGADRPEDWARSDMAEDIPQLARFLILRRLWADAIDGWRRPGALDAIPAARRLLAAGAAAADLQTLARAAAYEAAFATVSIIDECCDPDLDGSLPCWCLQETDGDGECTGRSVDGLHESLLWMDPSGNEGKDLWE
jgi:hypothetical protein